MELEKYNALSMDIKNLMSCIRCHEDSQNEDVVLETLKTIMDVCSNESCGRDAFREAGGLDFLVEFLFLTDNTKFLEHTLKTLAFVIDENVHSQMYLSKKSVLEVLRTIWKKQSFSAEMRKNALVLISVILYHNSTAQNLVFEVGLLQDLLNMYEQYAQGLMMNSSCISSNSDISSLNFWTSTNSALCFAVNNPQNEKNQDMCQNIFPVCLQILEFSSNSAVISAVASFLTLTITDNAKCQDYFSSCDGFLVLKRCFQKYFDALLADMKICNGIARKETYQAINCIIGIISAACLNNEKNAAICGDLEILSLMIKLLLMETFDCQLKTKIVLSLGHSIDACCTNKSYVLQTANFDAFLKKSLQLEDAELSFACKYLLQVCLANRGSHESDFDCPKDNSFESTSPLNDNLKDILTLNEMDAEHVSLKKSATKVPRNQSPILKVNNNSRSLGKTYSSSSSFENISQSAHKRRQVSKISKRPRNKLSSIKKEYSSKSCAVQCDLLSNYQLSPRGKTFSASIHSNTNLDSPKRKSEEKGINQSSHTYDEFKEQNIIANKMPFTDFLLKETKSNSLKSESQSLLKTVCTKSASDSLFSEWHAYNKARLNKNVKLSNISSKRECISQDNHSSSSTYAMKLSNENSVQEKFPKLFKKKKGEISSDLSSSSSSEYSFTPPKVKNRKCQEKENIPRFGYSIPYQTEINIPKISKDSIIKNKNNNYENSCIKWNSNDEFQTPARKPLFSFNAENQFKNKHQAEFSLKLSPSKFENGCSEGRSFLNSKIIPEIGKENSFDLENFTDVSLKHGKRLMDSGFSSNYASQSSRNSDAYFDVFYQATNQTPKTSKIFGSPFRKKHSRSFSSCGSCDESFSTFSSPITSSRHVQVIVLPKETCEQHGLSASVELLEVVSLEDIKG